MFLDRTRHKSNPVPFAASAGTRLKNNNKMKKKTSYIHGTTTIGRISSVMFGSFLLSSSPTDFYRISFERFLNNFGFLKSDFRKDDQRLSR